MNSKVTNTKASAKKYSLTQEKKRNFWTILITLLFLPWYVISHVLVVLCTLRSFSFHSNMLPFWTPSLLYLFPSFLTLFCASVHQHLYTASSSSLLAAFSQWEISLASPPSPFLVFLGPHPWHMEVPRLGTELEL